MRLIMCFIGMVWMGCTTESKDKSTSSAEIDGVFISDENNIREESTDTAREDQCAERADAAMDDCYDNGGTDEECRRVYEAAYNDCVNGGDEDSSECEEAGDEAMQDCYDNGGTDEECREAYAEAYDACDDSN